MNVRNPATQWQQTVTQRQRLGYSRIPATQWQHILTQLQRLVQDERPKPRHAVAAYPNPTATPWEMCDIPMKSSKNRKIPKQIETDRKIKYKLKYLFRFSIQIKGIFTIFNHQKLLFHAECRSFYCKYILNNEL